MKPLVCLICLCLLSCEVPHDQAALEHRWVFSHGYGRNRDDVDTIKSLAVTASKHGLNGVVLSSFGLDRVTRWSQEDHDYFNEIKALCDEMNVELIPVGFSVGYGGGAFGHDPNFAAAVPTSVTLVARNGRLEPVASNANLIDNGGFEEVKGKRLAGFALRDKPGKVSFSDTDTVYAGGKSIRYENFGASRGGHGRLMQEVRLQSGRSYRFSVMVKTQDLQPSSSFRLQLYRGDNKITSVAPAMKSTQDWTEVAMEFTSTLDQTVRFYAGCWKSESGKLWMDAMKCVEESQLSTVVRRDGAPLVLVSQQRDMTFAEGVDFEELEYGHQEPYVRLLPGTAIEDGEALTLSYYSAPIIRHSWGRQISLCMSNPDLYRYWEEQARVLYDIHPFKSFFLEMDEIRNGGGCELCRNSGKSMAEILGDCVTKQYEMLRKLDPEMEVYIWSDMLDPNHNARDDYYGVVGDFSGSWKYVPKDITIMCWHYKKRDKSLGFFSGKGFKTAGACYYDGKDLINPTAWLASLKRTRGATTIMYTSWRERYELLSDFGDLVSGSHP